MSIATLVSLATGTDHRLSSATDIPRGFQEKVVHWPRAVPSCCHPPARGGLETIVASCPECRLCAGPSCARVQAVRGSPTPHLARPSGLPRGSALSRSNRETVPVSRFVGVGRPAPSESDPRRAKLGRITVGRGRGVRSPKQLQVRWRGETLDVLSAECPYAKGQALGLHVRTVDREGRGHVEPPNTRSLVIDSIPQLKLQRATGRNPHTLQRQRTRTARRRLHQSQSQVLTVCHARHMNVAGQRQIVVPHNTRQALDTGQRNGTHQNGFPAARGASINSRVHPFVWRAATLHEHVGRSRGTHDGAFRPTGGDVLRPAI